MNPRRLKALVIEWLGATYRNDMPGNPDYTNEREVDDLVEQIAAATTKVEGGKPSLPEPPEQGSIIHWDGWVTWYWTKDRTHVVMLWRDGMRWVSYPREAVASFARGLSAEVNRL